MKRVGITQRVDVIKSYGERRDALDQQWNVVLAAADCLMVPIPNGQADAAGYCRALGLDGVLLSGGNDLASLPGASHVAPEREVLEDALLRWAMTKAKPVLAVCRGLHQVVHHFGGDLLPVQGHVAVVHGLRWSESSSWRFPWRERSEVNSYHGFAIAAGLDDKLFGIVARDADGRPEAIEHRQEKIAGMMWHPEREPRFDGDVDFIREFFAA